MAFKVPPHLSKEFHALSQEERLKFIKSYHVWYNHELTQALIESLEERIDSLIKEEEQKSGFSTLFESKYYNAENKAKRKVLRELKKQLNPEV